MAGKRSIGVRHHCGGFGYDSGGGWTQERQVEDAPGLFLCLGGGKILVDMVQNLGLRSVLVARNPSEGVRYDATPNLSIPYALRVCALSLSLLVIIDPN